MDTNIDPIDYNDYESQGKPPSIMNWLSNMLDFNKIGQERQDIVNDMLASYIKSIAEDYPEHLESLVEYLQNYEQRFHFKSALNNINLVVTLSFMIQEEKDYQQAIRLIMFHCREDEHFAKFMKLYYLNHLDIHDFSGIVQNQAEYQHIQQRLNYFKEEYQQLIQ